MPAKPKEITLVCGLGNPGDEYARTRHSIGFATVDALAARAGVTYWKSQAGCEVATMRVRGADGPREVVLAKPQSYMNTSGGPLSKLISRSSCASCASPPPRCSSCTTRSTCPRAPCA